MTGFYMQDKKGPRLVEQTIITFIFNHLQGAPQKVTPFLCLRKIGNFCANSKKLGRCGPYEIYKKPLKFYD